MLKYEKHEFEKIMIVIIKTNKQFKIDIKYSSTTDGNGLNNMKYNKVMRRLSGQEHPDCGLFIVVLKGV